MKNPVASEVANLLWRGSRRGMPMEADTELIRWLRERAVTQERRMPEPGGSFPAEVSRTVGVGQSGNHFITALNKQGQKVRVAGPFPSRAAAEAEARELERQMFLKHGNFDLKLLVEPEGNG